MAPVLLFGTVASLCSTLSNKSNGRATGPCYRMQEWHKPHPGQMSIARFRLCGLGTTVQMLKNVCRDDIDATTLIDQAVQKPGGRPSKTGNNVPSLGRPRRLRDHRRDLHARVLAEELSTHRAMIEAGFRTLWSSSPPAFDVPCNSGAARLLDDDFCRKSSRLLLESTKLLVWWVPRAEGIAGPSPARVLEWPLALADQCLLVGAAPSLSGRSIRDIGRSVARYFTGQLSSPGRAWPSSFRGGLPVYPYIPMVPDVPIGTDAPPRVPPPPARWHQYNRVHVLLQDLLACLSGFRLPRVPEDRATAALNETARSG
jgi:hypothetical protein